PLPPGGLSAAPAPGPAPPRWGRPGRELGGARLRRASRGTAPPHRQDPATLPGGGVLSSSGSRGATGVDPAEGSALLLLGLGVGLADLVHVQVLHLADEVLERGLRQGARLGEDRDALAVGDEGRDGGDAVAHGEILLVLGVDLREGDVLVLLRGLLIDRGEALTRHAPARPEVDQDDAVLDGLVVVLGGRRERSHDRWNASAPGIIPPRPRCEPAHPPAVEQAVSPSGPPGRRGRVGEGPRRGAARWWRRPRTGRRCGCP